MPSSTNISSFDKGGDNLRQKTQSRRITPDDRLRWQLLNLLYESRGVIETEVLIQRAGHARALFVLEQSPDFRTAAKYTWLPWITKSAYIKAVQKIRADKKANAQRGAA